MADAAEPDDGVGAVVERARSIVGPPVSGYRDCRVVNRAAAQRTNGGGDDCADLARRPALSSSTTVKACNDRLGKAFRGHAA